MSVDVLYEAIEYGKVLLGYVFLMFLAPSVIFYKHLSHKPLVYRFGFCVTVVPVCLNMLVLVLGLFHILSMHLTALILAGTIGVSVVRLIWPHLVRTYRQDLTAQRMYTALHFPNFLRKENAVYIFLWAVILLFGAVYFTYGAFQVSCYGFGDLYVHHSWIYGLMQGEIYKGGIYPQAMHCFVFCLKALLGIPVFSGLRFLQCVHVVVFLVSAGCLLTEIFRWRYTPILALLLFLTLNVRGAVMITIMSRLQWSLPMEFGLPYVFLCALFLIRYIKGAAEEAESKDARAYWKNENLLIFALAVAAVLSTHYFSTIMAFLVCLAAALSAFRKVFRPKCLLPLVAAALCSLLITSVPMVWALAGGVPFQGSINWALNTISEVEATGTQALPGITIGTRIARLCHAIYREGYARLYGKDRGTLLLALSGVSLALCLVGKIRRAKWAKGTEYGYIPMILMSVIYVVTYAMPQMGLPQIIAEGRFSSIGHPLTLASALIPLDIAGAFTAERYGKVLLRRAAVVTAIVIYAVIHLSGNYHGFLYYELSRYPSAVTLTRTIMENCEPHTYVIVSTTDELYQMIEKGLHIELLSFLENTEDAKDEYYLWTNDLFFFVEKKPLYYAQLYFAQGPSWLAKERYPDDGWRGYQTMSWGISQAPYVITSEISPDKAQQEILETDPWKKYLKLQNREVLESQAYEQCMHLMAAYPDQMEIYYEDEYMVCFHLKQEFTNPCNLAI